MSTPPDKHPEHPPHILVIGSSNTDFVIKCEHLPKPGETQLGGAFEQFHGGKGANQAVAAARAGAKVAFIGLHGDDDHGRAAKQSMNEAGINTGYFLETTGGVPSGVAMIFLGGSKAENMIAVAKSANDKLHPEHLQRARGAFDNSDIILSQLEVPMAAVEMAAVLATEYETPFILNPAPAQPLSERLLRRIHTLIPNELELRTLTGKKSVTGGARALREAGCRHVVVTLGDKGAYVDAEGAEPFTTPGQPVTAVDTVGAGDCFASWYAVGVAEHLSLPDAVARATQAAAISITRPGAQPSMPFRSELDAAPSS